jgi:hypothetical protein
MRRLCIGKIVLTAHGRLCAVTHSDHKGVNEQTVASARETMTRNSSHLIQQRKFNMKTSLRIAFAIIAGAGLSGCASDGYYADPGYSSYDRSVYSSGYSDPRYGYYDQRQQRPYYSDRPSGYIYR